MAVLLYGPGNFVVEPLTDRVGTLWWQKMEEYLSAIKDLDSLDILP